MNGWSCLGISTGCGLGVKEIWRGAASFRTGGYRIVYFLVDGWLSSGNSLGFVEGYHFYPAKWYHVVEN